MTPGTLTAKSRTGSATSHSLIVGATAVGLGLVLAGLANPHAGWAAMAAIAAVLVAAAIFVRVLGWKVGLIVLLIVTTLVDRYTFPVGRIDIRPEQVAAVLATVVLVVSRIRRRNFSWLRPAPVEILLVAWFAIGLVSSIFEAQSRGESLKILSLLILSSLAMVLPPRLVDLDRDAMNQVARWFLLAVAVESAYAVLAYLVHVAGPTVSLSVNPATGHLDAYGTLWEPNVLGAIAGAGALGWTFLGGRHFGRPWIGIALCLTACTISYTRAAWLAVILVFIFALTLPVRKRVALPPIWAAGATLVVAIPILFAIDKVGGYSSGGVGGAVTNGTDVLGRLYQFRTALLELRHSPFIGGGIDSYGQRHVLAGAPEHLANLMLSVVNDTGIVGLLVFSAFIIAIVLVAWRSRGDLMVLGMSAMMLVLAITNQATETLEVMITWLLIGLLLAAARVASAVSEPETSGTSRDTGP